MTSSQRWTMLAAILGSSMVFLDGTVINLALPRIGEELPATIVSTLEGQTYPVSGYLATLAALLVADHGRRPAVARPRATGHWGLAACPGRCLHTPAAGVHRGGHGPERAIPSKTTRRLRSRGVRLAFLPETEGVHGTDVCGPNRETARHGATCGGRLASCRTPSTPISS